MAIIVAIVVILKIRVMAIMVIMFASNAGNIRSGMNASHGPKMNIMKSIQGVSFFRPDSCIWVCLSLWVCS